MWKSKILIDWCVFFPQSIFWLCRDDLSVYEPTRHQIDEQIFRKYTKHYYHEDYLLPENLFKHAKQKPCVAMTDVIPKEKYEKTYYYNDFLKPQRLKNEIGVYLYNEKKLIGGISFVVPNYELGTSKEERIALSILSHFIALKLEQLKQKDKYSHINMSPAEKRVFERLILGETDEEIAQALHISVYTVKKHLQHLYKKNGVSNRTSLIAKATLPNSS